jgi:hypothetical protein
LGFFAGEEARIPYDFHEMLACIAPRPLLVIAPTWDQYASFPDVQHCMEEVKKVYDLYKQEDNLTLFAPEEYNHLSDGMKEHMIHWMKKHLK